MFQHIDAAMTCTEDSCTGQEKVYFLSFARTVPKKILQEYSAKFGTWSHCCTSSCVHSRMMRAILTRRLGTRTVRRIEAHEMVSTNRASTDTYAFFHVYGFAV